MNEVKIMGMKRILFILFAAMNVALCNAGTEAMSNSRVRKETRFLTDKMAYELNLSDEQYNDVYEINYDFISGVRYVMDDVLRGYEWALDRYYDYLDVRNYDLRWVLSSRQYGRFIRADYFYRPIYTSGNHWYFRVYITYTNHNHFFFPRPYHYHTYVGAHYRTHFHNASYYKGRYKHSAYNGSYRIRDNKSYITNRRSDFGSVNIRPGTSREPARKESTSTRRSTPRDTSTSRTTSTSRSSADTSRSNTNSSQRNTTRTTDTERRESRSSSVRSSSGNNTRSSGSSSARSGNSSRSSRSSGDRR